MDNSLTMVIDNVLFVARSRDTVLTGVLRRGMSVQAVGPDLLGMVSALSVSYISNNEGRTSVLSEHNTHFFPTFSVLQVSNIRNNNSMKDSIKGVIII